MGQTEVLELINKHFSNRCIEGYNTKNFDKVKKETPKKYNFSYVTNCNNKGVFIRIINADDIFNFNSIELLVKWEESLKYGNKFLCIVVAVKDNQIIPNIMYGNKLYYSRNDIKTLYNDFSKIISNQTKEIKNIESSKPIMIYNHNTSWEVYKKYSNNDMINKLYSMEFESKDVIGCLVASCIDYNPISFYDAANHYFTYAELNKNLYIRDRGLTKSEVIELATRFARRVKEVTYYNEVSMSVEEAFHYLMYNIINKTFIGYFAEKTLADVFIKEGYLIFKSNADLDQNYGVDLKVKNEDKEFAIQIKSKWFLKTITKKDINKLKEQYNKTLRDEKLETFYAFYSLDEHNNYTWEVSKDGSCLFNINFIENLN